MSEDDRDRYTGWVPAFDPKTIMFGWGRPFDPYDPALPVSVSLPATDKYAAMTLARGCRLSSSIWALQLRGMEELGA